MHAFEFTERPEYVAMASRGFNVVFAGPNFAHWLLDKMLLTEVGDTEAREGDLVFYFNEEARAKHAGLYLGGGRVESKWGKAHLLHHDLFDVPESYGLTVRFFRKVGYKTAIEYFERFARENGLLFD